MPQYEENLKSEGYPLKDNPADDNSNLLFALIFFPPNTKIEIQLMTRMPKPKIFKF